MAIERPENFDPTDTIARACVVPKCKNNPGEAGLCERCPTEWAVSSEGALAALRLDNGDQVGAEKLFGIWLKNKREGSDEED